MRDNDTINLVLLGSTGSIGRQTLEVVDKYPERFKIVALAAKDEVDELKRQIIRYKPKIVAVDDDYTYRQLKDFCPAGVEVKAGIEGMCELASLEEVDFVLIAVSGAVGIKPTLAAIRAGKRIGLANKETLVVAGDIVMQEARARSVQIIPVDSEHSAIFQCLKGEEKNLKKIWLTASGGPFREFSLQDLARVTVDMALKHPNWKMGPKITVDSATLMNKGLEVIEAHHLFGVDYDRIEVLVHPESIIHSLVELVDGSFIAHLGVPDMRIPIQYALTYPERLVSLASPLDFFALKALHFAKPDRVKFPALDLAYQAGKTGGSMPAVLNGANEVAVGAFIRRQISFLAIPAIVEKVMQKHTPLVKPTLDDILAIDAWARKEAEYLVLKEAN
ncbi:1-deoxy-D-xylulose 5-phosphate reductoisomerase [Thermosyntropha lipolytica DSM 11003]|uniref:1-deoxy-D-xylulose 5-phosphate reductoisomerase n=1 Tax=Thermosyntropha lipolytica DSM 11003 TaxID=1123382 RepID=A0A1M5KWD6_9FIRM|nr:1-deoxy-D-xylulose-5-phosphate reductoisomerase [Thermosyntropha lipolytica]SHG57118.1 1-deoxy-D-xylulose 5-phosphate reductoisomerase [Thermosyntropha lipolytica DSM 11003]